MAQDQRREAKHATVDEALRMLKAAASHRHAEAYVEAVIRMVWEDGYAEGRSDETAKTVVP